ncbi:MAG: hypothetical protein AMXMBFR36_21420 [Acidobacteriota bacterium]
MPYMIQPEWIERAFAGESVSAGGEEHQFSVHQLGQVELPSGRLAASDPFVTPDPEPFPLSLKPGKYPVDIAVSQVSPTDQRVAFARVRFSDEAPRKWAMVSVGGQDASLLGPEEILGYGVDAGTGCFMSPEAGVLLAKRMNRESSYFESMIEEMQRSYRDTWSWSRIQPAPSESLGIIAFSSGYGDGVYASYLGSNGSGAPACLVTDFGIVSATPVGETATPPASATPKKRPWWRFWE